MLVRDIHPFFFASESARPLSCGPPSRSVAGDSGGAGEDDARSSPAHYLALDQSAQLIGWAKGARGMERPEANTFGLPTLTGPNGEDEIGAVVGQVRKFLQDQFRDDPHLSHVIYESVYYDEEKRNPETFGQLCAVKAIVRLTCIDHRKTCIEVTPQEWRKAFLGYSDARALKGTSITLKEAAIARCEDLDWTVANEHEAEACGILTWALCQRFPEFATETSPLFRPGRAR